MTAIFIAAGDLVIGALRGCAELGRVVPRDVSIVCFDDHPFFANLTPSITAVSQPIEEIGAAAVEMLFELMAARQPQRKAMIIAPRLMQRASCAEPRRPFAIAKNPLVEGERIL